MLNGLERPVIVTGSQIPLSQPGNDARPNLLGTMRQFQLDLPDEVFVFFDEQLYYGNRTTKIKATGLDAFSSPKAAPASFYSESSREEYKQWEQPHTKRFCLPELTPARIGVVRLFPGIDSNYIEAVFSTGLQGLVLECYGVGNGPGLDDRLMTALRMACDRGVVIVGISQCLDGSVNLGAYAAGSALADAGVVNGYDMTLEAAFTKLHYLFGLGFSPDKVARHIPVSLCGEVNSGIDRI
jgi:L-asparaginase